MTTRGKYRQLSCSTKSGSEYQRLFQAAHRERLRNAAHAAYGGACACCGEANTAFLTIDHVAEDGAEHRGPRGAHNAAMVYTWLAKNAYPSGFQVLCFNCNCARSMRGDGVCPHARPVLADAAQARFDAFKADRADERRKLGVRDESAIRALHEDGFSQKEIAGFFQVDPSHVSRIVRKEG